MRTENVFLNITQQKDCLNDAFCCGFEKLTNGAGGCSDYTVTDVISNFGSALESLDQGCKNVDLDGDYDKECGTCFGTWERIVVSDNKSNASMKEETGICRFLLLVSLTSQRIQDSGWIHSVYMCLVNGVHIDDQERNVKKVRFVKGLEVLIGGVIGITLAVAVALVVLLRKPSKVKPPKITEGKVYKGVLADCRHIAVKYMINDAHCEGGDRASLFTNSAAKATSLNGFMAKNLMKGKDITKFSDPKLSGEYSVDGFQLLFKLALSCTGLKQQRPSMERVVAVLEKAHRVSKKMSFKTSFQ